MVGREVDTKIKKYMSVPSNNFQVCKSLLYRVDVLLELHMKGQGSREDGMIYAEDSNRTEMLFELGS